MDLFSSDEFWAAIVGALVGGLVAAITQWRFSKVQQEQQRLDREQQKKEREQERAQAKLERDQALATSLMFKLMKASANLIVTKHHVDQCFANAQAVGPDTQPWQLLTHIVNVSEPMHFSSEEMAVLLAQSDDKVFHLVLGLDGQHNSIMTVLRSFRTLREAVEERLEPHRIIERVDGEQVDVRYPMEVILNLRPRTIELNSLVKILRGTLPQDVQTARDATEAAQALFRKNLGLKFKIQINDPPAANAPPPGA